MSLTNVLVSVTNQLQFTTNLSAGSWTAFTNLVLQPPCGSNVLSQFVKVTVPKANLPSVFWRIKQ